MLINGKEVSVRDACGTLWYGKFSDVTGIYFLQNTSIENGEDQFSFVKLINKNVIYASPMNDETFELHFRDFGDRFTYLGRISDLDLESYLEEKKHEGII